MLVSVLSVTKVQQFSEILKVIFATMESPFKYVKEVTI